MRGVHLRLITNSSNFPETGPRAKTGGWSSELGCPSVRCSIWCSHRPTSGLPAEERFGFTLGNIVWLLQRRMNPTLSSSTVLQTIMSNTCRIVCYMNSTGRSTQSKRLGRERVERANSLLQVVSIRNTVLSWLLGPKLTIMPAAQPTGVGSIQLDFLLLCNFATTANYDFFRRTFGLPLWCSSTFCHGIYTYGLPYSYVSAFYSTSHSSGNH